MCRVIFFTKATDFGTWLVIQKAILMNMLKRLQDVIRAWDESLALCRAQARARYVYRVFRDEIESHRRVPMRQLYTDPFDLLEEVIHQPKVG
jgi:hypothetical protein